MSIQPTSLSLSIGAQPTGAASAQQVLLKLKQELNDVTQGIGNLEALLGGTTGGFNPIPAANGNTGITGIGLPVGAGLGSGFPNISAGFGLGSSGLGAGLGTGLFGSSLGNGIFGPSLGSGLGSGLFGLPSTGTGLPASQPTGTQGASQDQVSTLVSLLTLLVGLLGKQNTNGVNDNGSGININNNNTNNNSANAGSSVVAPAPRPVAPPPPRPVANPYGAPSASAGSVSQAAAQGTKNTSIAGSSFTNSPVQSGNTLKNVQQKRSQLFNNNGAAIGINNSKGNIAATNQGPAAVFSDDSIKAILDSDLVKGLLSKQS